MTDYQWKPNELHELVEGLPVPEGLVWHGEDNGGAHGYEIKHPGGRFGWGPLPPSAVAALYTAMLVEELAKRDDWIVKLWIDPGGNWMVQAKVNHRGPTLLHALVAAWKAAQ